LSRQVEYVVGQPGDHRVDAGGLIHPLTDGATQLTGPPRE